MAKGSVYNSERAIWRDPRSGLRIIRLTHYSTISTNLYFEMCSFTEDDAYVVVLSQRGAGRDAPWDLMRARTDGTELVQMTACDAMAGAVVSPATHCALYQAGRELWKVDLHSLKEEPVAELPGALPEGPPSLGSVDAAGTAYYGSCAIEGGRGVLFRAEVATGKITVLDEGKFQNHIHIDPLGKTLYFGVPADCQPYLVDAEGGHLRKYPFMKFAHLTWFGTTGLIQGTLIPPGHAIVTYKEGDAEPVVIAQGRYYWHSSASSDAQWIVSDTNWPQEGLFLIHAPTGGATYICDPRSSCSHPQWTHPHPSLSPGMKYVLFNSDLTGIGQAYVAELTPEFVDKASKGYDCKPILAM